MNPKISFQEKIFVAGSKGMVGSAICRALKKKGYGQKSKGGSILTPDRQELDLSTPSGKKLRLWQITILRN